MKVTTDACTLGAWAPIESARTILDIGTGSGLLALFAAQRAPNATVDAIELDTESALQARSNFNLSPFNDRLTLIEGDITTFTTGKTYDAILCNPPFFSDSTLNDCSRLSQARHDTHLSLDALLASIRRLLNPHGKAYVLLPTDAAPSLDCLKRHGLHLRHTFAIASEPDDAPHRVILTISPEEGDLQQASLILYAKHPIHSVEAGRLFYPFYTRLRCESPEFSR